MSAIVAPASPVVWRDQFPASFRWGCATSAYQIEGGVAEDGRGESIWDHFCARPGRVRNGASGAVTCDHYHRWPGDLDIAQQMGLNAYRFSIAWPRVFPEGRGRQPNGRGLDFYERLVDGMLARGLEPWATLYHWDLPQALQASGGWRDRDTCRAFMDYAQVVASRLGDRVKHWITHNEPWCTAFVGHYEGVHAPGERDLRGAFQACHHVLLSHGMAVPVIRQEVPDARVGIVLSLHPLRAASPEQADREAVARYDGWRNRWFLDPLYGRGYPQDTWALVADAAPEVVPGDLEVIGAATDFLGVNYYFPETVAAAPGARPVEASVRTPAGAEITAFGWQVEPGGMTRLLERVHAEYGPPEIYLTENGATYDDVPADDGSIRDTERLRYLVRHVKALHEAVERGVPVKGYFVWSLLDNFEWAEGYARRFGLVHVDFGTQRRQLKQSGAWYRDFLHDRASAGVP